MKPPKATKVGLTGRLDVAVEEAHGVEVLEAVHDLARHAAEGRLGDNHAAPAHTTFSRVRWTSGVG